MTCPECMSVLHNKHCLSQQVILSASNYLKEHLKETFCQISSFKKKKNNEKFQFLIKILEFQKNLENLHSWLLLLQHWGQKSVRIVRCWEFRMHGSVFLDNISFFVHDYLKILKRHFHSLPRVPKPPYFLKTPYIDYPLPLHPFSNFARTPQTPTNCSFCCLVSLAEWMIAPYLMWYFTSWCYGSTQCRALVPDGHWCVLCNKASGLLKCGFLLVLIW